MMRASGILMHISSLPGDHGIGKLGKEAYAFADFLKKAGQKYWQILPVSPTSYGDSPYQSFSVYAGNPYCARLMKITSLQATARRLNLRRRTPGRLTTGFSWR